MRSGSLAALYGSSTGSTELSGMLRAVGWGAIAVVRGCVPPWLFHYLDQRDYPRAIVMALAGIIRIGVKIAGSLGGLAKSADELGERGKAITAAKDHRAELERIRRDREKLSSRPIGTIRAEIEAARASKAYKATDGCEPERRSASFRETPATPTACSKGT